MVVYIVQTKAELLLAKNGWFIIYYIKCFFYFIVPLQPCGMWFTKNLIGLYFSLAYKEHFSIKKLYSFMDVTKMVSLINIFLAQICMSVGNLATKGLNNP